MSPHSSEPAARPASSGTRPLWAVVALLLLIGILVPLLVGFYDSEKPTLFGFPFFYWFQFLLIPVVSTLTYLAFRLSESATARERRAHGRRRRQP